VTGMKVGVWSAAAATGVRAQSVVLLLATACCGCCRFLQQLPASDVMQLVQQLLLDALKSSLHPFKSIQCAVVVQKQSIVQVKAVALGLLALRSTSSRSPWY